MRRPCCTLGHRDAPSLDAGLGLHEGLCTHLRWTGRTTQRQSSSGPSSHSGNKRVSFTTQAWASVAQPVCWCVSVLRAVP